MKIFNKVAIVGTGLMGGSIAMAIKKNKLASEVVGVSRHKKNILLAKKRGVIDNGSQNLKIIKGADLVVLATPLDISLRLAAEIKKNIKEDCIVIDVASTKEKAVLGLEKIFKNFLGTHPIAGSEKKGVSNASSHLLNGAVCVLTPTKSTPSLVIRKVEKLYAFLSMKTVNMSPKEHDRILSLTSHLAHIIAFVLIDTVPAKYFKFSSGGLKDTTRIAASDPNLWSDIFLNNPQNINKAVRVLQKRINLIKDLINSRDKKRIVLFLSKAQKKRLLLK